MAVSVAAASVEYTGDGSTTTFPITFAIQENSQVKVSQLDTVSEVTSILTEGVEYTLTGSPLATNVVYGVAPASTIEVTVYRVTPKLQETEYIATGPFPADAHEDALDRIVMMIQELTEDLGSVDVSSTGGITELTEQTVAAAGTLTVGSDANRIVKRVKGATALAEIATIADGEVGWQELILIGTDSALPLVIPSLSNLKLGGSMTMNLNSALTLMWDDSNNYWTEISRRD
jgi:hypothetical protein